MTEIIFKVQEDVLDGGLVAHVLGAGIHTEGDTLDDLKANTRDAVECHFDAAEMPRVVRLHFARDEVMAVCGFPATRPYWNWPIMPLLSTFFSGLTSGRIPSAARALLLPLLINNGITV